MPSITQQDYRVIHLEGAFDDEYSEWGEEALAQIAKAVVNDTIFDVVLVAVNDNEKARIPYCFYDKEEDKADISIINLNKIVFARISNLSQYLPQEEIIN